MAESKAQHNARKRKWAKANPERRLAIRRKYLYGVDAATVRARLNAQGGRCKICTGNNGGKPLHLDHDHATGKPRGLLCGNCNRGIGLFRDNHFLLLSASAYLTLWETFNSCKKQRGLA